MPNVPVSCLGGLALVLLLSCASPQQAVTPSAAPTVYDFTTEGRIPPPPAVLPSPTSIASLAAPTGTTGDQAGWPGTSPVLRSVSPPGTARAAGVGAVSGAIPAAGIDADTTQGWRVQVFAGHSLETAETIRQELQAHSAEMVYIDHVEPYYKVRVGDCVVRQACEELQRHLYSAGRQSAWVVPSRIHR